MPSNNLDNFISLKYSTTTGYLARAVVNNILTGGQLETSAVDIDEGGENDDKCKVSWNAIREIKFALRYLY